MDNSYEIVKFVDNEFELEVNVSPKEETVWLSAEEMASLFCVNRPAIVKHTINILKSGELEVSLVPFWNRFKMKVVEDY